LPAFAATFQEQHIHTVAVLSCFYVYVIIIKYILLSRMNIEERKKQLLVLHHPAKIY